MTRHDPAVVDSLDDALAAATPQLDADEQRLAVTVYRLLARGTPVSVPAATAEARLPPAMAEEAVSSWPAVFHDTRGIVGFWGLALQEMTHRLNRAGIELSAWCAWDPLFLALVIGELEVRTHDPVTNEPITYHVAQDGTVSGLVHPHSVMSFLYPKEPWGDDVMARFCHFVWHFTTLDSAKRWIADHPGTIALSLDEARELAQRHVDRTFGSIRS